MSFGNLFATTWSAHFRRSGIGGPSVGCILSTIHSPGQRPISRSLIIMAGSVRFMPSSGARISLTCHVLLLASCTRPVPSVAEGRSLYLANGCASCHGRTGAGDGPLAAKLNSHPTDLRDVTRFRNGAGEVAVANTLANGIPSTQMSNPELHHTHHDLAMPKFDHLTDLERRSIARYVISIGTGRGHP
jgi:cytochrome c553